MKSLLFLLSTIDLQQLSKLLKAFATFTKNQIRLSCQIFCNNNARKTISYKINKAHCRDLYRINNHINFSSITHPGPDYNF